MYEIIGINYERGTSTPSIIRMPGRTSEILNEVYNHGKALWDAGDCSKYLVALLLNGKMVDYNRPDYWNFGKKTKFDEETSHFPNWDYAKTPCPYEDRIHHNGESQEYLMRMCKTYQEILQEEGALCRKAIESP